VSGVPAVSQLPLSSFQLAPSWACRVKPSEEESGKTFVISKNGTEAVKIKKE